ncbi:MAG: hypothetical protein JNN15_16095, partial [Blastocatellia bacterium]|nr:hypothetical protein [Blastocatellia bacterium]
FNVKSATNAAEAVKSTVEPAIWNDGSRHKSKRIYKEVFIFFIMPPFLSKVKSSVLVVKLKELLKV